MKIIDVDQGSESWKELRKTKIGGSDAASIMGIGFLTPYQLWEQKVLGKETTENDAMRRGKDLEGKARDLYIQTKGIEVNPAVILHDNDWMMASLDGISLNGEIALEIKAPGPKDHATAFEGKVPEKYYPQCQHIMEVCQLNEMDYFSFDGVNGVVVKVFRDNDYIKKLLEKEYEFWQRVQNLDPPELTERDYKKKSGIEWELAVKEYLEAKEAISSWEEKEKIRRKNLIEISNGQNCIGSGVRVQRVVSQGRVDYSIVKELQGIDLEPYRKPRTETWKITEV